MTLTIYRDADADLEPLRARRIAVLGYGNQGRAHALNLRDSGLDVIVGQRPGKSRDRAVEDGFDPLPPAEATRSADLLIFTLPDESAAEIYETTLRRAVRTGQTFGFVHGFNIRFGFIRPPHDVDVIMIAPKGPGTLLRSLYEAGKGLPALLAVHQDATGNARDIALAWAKGIGSTRAGVIETTFAAETETDLFGEQVVLCGGLTALTKAAFETLVEAGYEPEFAYLECVHELKQIVDLLYERGLSAMRDRISNTAEYGDLTRGPRIVNESVRAEMKRILEEIRSGAFAREWIEEYRSGGKRFRKLHDADAGTLYERAGETVRSWMPWLAGQPSPASSSTDRDDPPS
ncbi:MAG: ketol-acid reductoisomerase [Planctomycetota bacterium]|nr:MAG: ketol-acid reductoisomerase [Planctomycetota bacterium]